MAMFRRSKQKSEPFRFRVSDALDMPLRGFLLRLRLLDGGASIADLGPGALLRLTTPTGRTRLVRVLDHSVTGGRQTQERLDRTRELDIVIARDDAYLDGEPAAIGWIADGPVAEDGSVAGGGPAAHGGPAAESGRRG
jgi:hypothetical protein